MAVIDSDGRLQMMLDIQEELQHMSPRERDMLRAICRMAEEIESLGHLVKKAERKLRDVTEWGDTRTRLTGSLGAMVGWARS